MDTTAAVMAGDRERVVTGSADFLEALLAVWEDQGVDPQTVWSELYARIEMGELSLKLSRAPGRRRTARHGPWRVATSKLP